MNNEPGVVVNQPEKVEINQGEGQQQPEPPKQPAGDENKPSDKPAETDKGQKA